jgi:hypothetical protein
MTRIVNVQHVYYATFEKGDAEYGYPEEVVVVFATSPSFAELVENVRRELNLMN